MTMIDSWAEKHPDWFETLLYEIEGGHEGWHNLVDVALRSVEQTQFDHPEACLRIVEIKEKFGALTIYCRSENLSRPARESLWEAVQAARTQSLLVCEICGSSAGLGRQRCRLMVRCQDCAPANWIPEAAKI